MPPAVGVAAALAGARPQRTVFSLFSLANRVVLVTGGHRGIGLEMALAMAEVGATVYCLDLPAEADADWRKVQSYAAQLPQLDNTKGRLEYMSGDVTNQEGMWKAVESIVEREGRIDVCVANAGISQTIGCLDYPAQEFHKIMDINVSGVFFTAQAAGRQMVRLGTPGSIILIASMNGSVANRNQHWSGYNTSKSAVLQMARSMACELASNGIRVNTISPGYTHSSMTRIVLQNKPNLEAELSEQNPLGRFGRPDELRGVSLWLASDASSFCTGSDIRVDGGQCAW
ncbi:hypothetical protein B0H17DRAFT_1051643 [Mycena rosella]|uniref:Sorbose reductase sou1 n=1 Tax=Mycena rosella TaxID=1033263 RepID=A0AAD7DSY5_MYCRO|nr:hypothetical protein B0H17DRAFT_1051643 [Mycena rosella]